MFPIFLQVYLAQDLQVLVLKTAKRNMLSHFFITFLYLFDDFIVSIIDLLKESLLELLLELDEGSEGVEHITLAEEMILMALAFLTTTLE